LVYLCESIGLNEVANYWRGVVADMTAQLLSPAAIQFISTNPLHLLGLDLYNQSSNTNHRSKEYLKSTMARIGRIGPAFGIGGICNKKFRDKLRLCYV
jgi:hypothetical protein